ncbi:hypothetical protein KI387_024179, partial [Taxus chinensis]
QVQLKIEEAYGDQVIQLKTNKPPKGLITLESIFDFDDANTYRRNFTKVKEDYVELEVANGKKLKVGKLFTQKERERLVAICHKYDR